MNAHKLPPKGEEHELMLPQTRCHPREETVAKAREGSAARTRPTRSAGSSPRQPQLKRQQNAPHTPGERHPKKSLQVSPPLHPRGSPFPAFGAAQIGSDQLFTLPAFQFGESQFPRPDLIAPLHPNNRFLFPSRVPFREIGVPHPGSESGKLGLTPAPARGTQHAPGLHGPAGQTRKGQAGSPMRRIHPQPAGLFPPPPRGVFRGDLARDACREGIPGGVPSRGGREGRLGPPGGVAGGDPLRPLQAPRWGPDGGSWRVASGRPRPHAAPQRARRRSPGDTRALFGPQRAPRAGPGGGRGAGQVAAACPHLWRRA